MSKNPNPIFAAVTAPQRSRERVRGDRGHPRILAVASGKGGVGKTLIAATLAHAMAQRGRKVLLFDGDLGLANIDIQLGLVPEIDLGTALDRDLPLRSVVTAVEATGFDVIAGRSGAGTLANLSPGRLTGVTEELAEAAVNYDRVVIDLGAGVERTVRHLAGYAGTVLVVINDEPTSLTDAYAFIKLLAQAKPRTDIRIIVNMAATPQEGEKTYQTLKKACDSFLGLAPPLHGIVRRDPQVKTAIRAQRPLLSFAPDGPAATDIARMADLLFAKPPPA